MKRKKKVIEIKNLMLYEYLEIYIYIFFIIIIFQ